MKTIVTIATLCMIAFASCRKSEDSPQPTPPPPPLAPAQLLTFNGRTDTVRFYGWGTLGNLKYCQFSGPYIGISFFFTQKPNSTKTYRIVYEPKADDEVSIGGSEISAYSDYYSEDTPAQYIEVSLSGSELTFSGSGIGVLQNDGPFGYVHVGCSFDLIDH